VMVFYHHANNLTMSRVCIAGIFRIHYAHAYYSSKDVFCKSEQSNYAFLSTNPPLDNAAILFVLGSVECNVGIICGSLPEIRPLLSDLMTRLETSISMTRMSYSRRGTIHPASIQASKVVRPGSENDFNGAWIPSSSRNALDSFEAPGQVAPEPKKIYLREGRKYRVLDDPKESTEFKNDSEESSVNHPSSR
jgi:hypothetical protein